MQGSAVRDHWPSIRVVVDAEIIYDGTVHETVTIAHQSTARPDQNMCSIDIEFYGKSDDDTEVDDLGNILSNQSVRLDQCWINGVDIIRTGAIHQNLGCYTMNLSQYKRQHLLSLGRDCLPTTHTHMFENGTWHLELALPLLSTLTDLHDLAESWEKASTKGILDDMEHSLTICRDLESKANRD